MSSDRIPDLLDRLHVRASCDLDLLLFLHRHTYALLAVETLAALTGYDPEEVARSCEVLVRAGLLERRQAPTRTAWMHVLVPGGLQGELLVSLLAMASTRVGRAEVLGTLARASSREEARARTLPAPEVPVKPRAEGNHA